MRASIILSCAQDLFPHRIYSNFPDCPGALYSRNIYTTMYMKLYKRFVTRMHTCLRSAANIDFHRLNIITIVRMLVTNLYTHEYDQIYVLNIAQHT